MNTQSFHLLLSPCTLDRRRPHAETHGEDEGERARPQAAAGHQCRSLWCAQKAELVVDASDEEEGAAGGSGGARRAASHSDGSNDDEHVEPAWISDEEGSDYKGATVVH